MANIDECATAKPEAPLYELLGLAHRCWARRARENRVVLCGKRLGPAETAMDSPTEAPATEGEGNG